VAQTENQLDLEASADDVSESLDSDALELTNKDLLETEDNI
jgi:hypothetical protein